MKKSINKFFLCIILFFIGFNIPAQAGNLEEILKDAQTGRNYQVPEKQELIIAQQLFEKLFKGELSRDLKKQWAKIYYDINEVQERGKKFIVVSENKAHKTGRGFYVFPDKKISNKILQMPHSFKDLYTGDIGLKLALEGSFSGIAWNTVPRYYKKDGIQNNADLSDLFDTYFAAFTKAFASCYENGYLIQLHGFSKNKRISDTGAKSDIILSAGTSFPNIWIKKMDTCLENNFSSIVSIYPIETRELGAMKTSIGILLNQMGHKGFIHVEMSKSMRIKMRDKLEYRKKFLNCMQKVFE